MFFTNAKPIWMNNKEKELNSNCFFKASFKKAFNMSLHITGSSSYKVYLNGKLLCVGPARAAHGFFRVDEIPLNDLNDINYLYIIAAGYNTFSYWLVNQPAFLQAEIFSENTSIIYTGRDFLVRNYNERIRKVSRFSYQRTFSEIYNFLNNDNEDFIEPSIVNGGKLLNRNVSYPTYELINSSLIEAGSFIIENKTPIENTWLNIKALKVFPLEEIKDVPANDVQLFTYYKGEIKNSLKEKEYAVFDLKHAETGFIKITCKVKEKATLYVIFDEMNINYANPSLPIDVKFDRNGCVNIVKYYVNKGNFTHSSYEPYTARFVKVVVESGEISALNIQLIKYENPDTDRFVFKCSDNRLEKIVEAAKRTFKQNAVDILTDCPSRERAGWLCDSYFSSKAEKLFTGYNKVEYNFLENYVEANSLKIPSKMVPMCYPADFENERYIPNWAMFYMIELYDEFLRSNDMLLANESKDKVINLISFFSKYENEYGLLENLESWVFIEWSKSNDDDFICGVNYPSNMLYSLALECAGKLYNNDNWLNKANKMKESIRKLSFNGDFFVDNSIRENGKLIQTKNISETCQYYAFFAKVATAKDYSSLFNTLVNCFGATRDETKIYPNVYKSNAFIGNYLRLIMLIENQRKDLISKECINYFYKMANLTGTLWEMDDTHASLDHCFASYAANIIVDYLIGYKGCINKEIIFSKPAIDIDCEIIIPINEDILSYKRINKEEIITLPKGYVIKKI